jgi:hypothetical protein
LTLKSELISICVDDNDDLRPIQYAPNRYSVLSLDSTQQKTRDDVQRTVKLGSGNQPDRVVSRANVAHAQ